MGQPVFGLEQGVVDGLVAREQVMQQLALDPHVGRAQAGALHLAAEIGRQVTAQVAGDVHGLPADLARLAREIDGVDIGQVARRVSRPERPARLSAAQEFAVADISRVVFVIAPGPGALAVPVAVVDLAIGAVMLLIVEERLHGDVSQFFVARQWRALARADGVQGAGGIEVVDIGADQHRILQPVEYARVVRAEVEQDFAAERHAGFELVALVIQPEVEAMPSLFVAGQLDAAAVGEEPECRCRRSPPKAPWDKSARSCGRRCRASRHRPRRGCGRARARRVLRR